MEIFPWVVSKVTIGSFVILVSTSCENELAVNGIKINEKMKKIIIIFNNFFQIILLKSQLY